MTWHLKTDLCSQPYLQMNIYLYFPGKRCFRTGQLHVKKSLNYSLYRGKTNFNYYLLQRLGSSNLKKTLILASLLYPSCFFITVKPNDHLEVKTSVSSSLTQLQKPMDLSNSCFTSTGFWSEKSRIRRKCYVNAKKERRHSHNASQSVLVGWAYSFLRPLIQEM